MTVSYTSAKRSMAKTRGFYSPPKWDRCGTFPAPLEFVASYPISLDMGGLQSTLLSFR